nr:efflux pump fus6 [Quercus suber]
MAYNKDGSHFSQTKHRNGPASTETTPLIIPNSATIDPSPRTANDSHPNDNVADWRTPLQDEGHTAANQTIPLTRALCCVLGLAILIFFQATNMSMMTTITSEINEDLKTSEQAIWFTSSYLIATAALSPLTGKLASVFSPRTCIFVASLWIALGGIVTGLASSFEVFVLGRILTGIGAAGVMTISIIIVLELSGSKRRGAAIGLLNSGYTIGVAVGATAAGALVPVTGWRALFYLQSPAAVIGGTILFLAIPHDFTSGSQKPSAEDGASESAGSSKPSTAVLLSRLDYLGALTLTTSIVLLLYSLSSPHGIPVVPIILSGIVLVAFLLNEVYLANDPIIPVTLLRSRGLLFTCLSTLGYMMVRWSVLFYAPTYALAVRGWSQASAGSILVPTNAGFALGGLAVGFLHIKRQGSFYLASLVAYSIFPVTLVALAFLSTQSSNVALYILTVFACGAATGAALNYTLAHLLHVTPKSTHYIATSLLATIRGFAGSFGAAVGGGIFTRRLSTSLEAGFENSSLGDSKELVRQLLGSPRLVWKLDGIERDIAISGYEAALKTLFFAGAGLAVVMILVQAGTGWKSGGEKSSVREEEQDSMSRDDAGENV